MRLRDVLILLLSSVVIFLSFSDRSEISVSRGFFSSVDTTLYMNGHHPTLHDRIPTPIVADLDGDGINEIVKADRTPELSIWSVSRYGSNSTQGNWPGLQLVKSVSLLPKILVTYGRNPVALATGYLDPDEGKPRKRHIVVVTSEWTVLCYNSDLKLEWETSLQDRFSNHFGPVEVSILIAPTILATGDRGVIVVGGRTKRIRNKATMDSKHVFQKDTGEDFGPGGKVENELEKERRLAEERYEARLGEEEGHFSYYALDGKKGTMRWHHELTDFQQNLHDEEVMFPQRSYKLDLKGENKHNGESDWRQFRESVILSLPFSWQGPEDTQLRLAHFTKRALKRERVNAASSLSSTSKPNSEEASSSKTLITDKVKAPIRTDPNDHSHTWAREALSTSSLSLSSSNSLSPSLSHYMEDPNVVLSYIAEGIEALHLYTGRPVCKITLYEGIYDDLDNDKVIDHAIAFVGEKGDELVGLRTVPTPCRGGIFAGVPPVDQTANFSICGAREQVLTRFDTTSVQSETLGTVNPVIVKRIEKNGEISKKLVFLLSTGKMTCVGSNGEEEFMISTKASWNADYVRKLSIAGSESADFSSVPSLQVFQALAGDDSPVDDLILAAGDKAVTIVDLTGEILAVVNLPEFPIAPVIIGDWDSDGHNDIIVPTKSGFYAFKVNGRVGVTLFRVLVGFFVAIILFFFLFSLVTHNTSRPKYRKLAE